MTHKLEVLKPRAGAAPAPPRVLADASLSLSFKLPAGFSRPPARASRPPPASSTSTSTSNEPNVPPRDSWSDDDDKEDDESWETRDFSAGLGAPSGDTAGHGKGDEDDELEDATSAAATSPALEVGGWEEQDALELPDDFPLLLVNLTRLQREHFPPEPSAAQSPLSADDMRQLFELVKQTLHRHFTQMAEVLFEQKSCFHCTYGTSRAMLANLHAAYPNDVFGLVDYPTEIQGIELSEFLHVLSRPSRWKSLDYLKDCLRRCSRDIKWKFDVALELDVLAEKEYEIYTTEQDRLSAEIDDLTRLRDSFKDKLAKLAAKERTGVKTKSSSQEYLLLRKLEDIETRLVSLLDTFLQEPELQEHECDGMFAGGAHGLTTGMNVLDMVVAMIFSRLPRDFSQQLTSEEHFQMLFDHHIHIRRLWKRDFGRLPPRSNAAAYADSDDDKEEEEKKAEAVAESQCRYDNDDHHYDDDVEDYQGSYDEVFDDEKREEDDDFHHYENVEMSPVTTTSRRGASSSGSWESVHADELREGSVRIELSGDEADREDSKSDGYGADYDSDESEDERPAAAASSSRSPRRVVAAEQTKPVRRVRVRKAPQPAVPTPSTTVVDAAEATETQLEKTETSKSSKKKKKKDKAKSKKKSKAKDEEPFQPFACTSALSLLRLAKENELF